MGVRTTAAILAMFAVALASLIGTVVLVTTLRQSLIEEIDRSIEARAVDIVSQWDSENEFIVLGAGFDDLTVAAVVDGNGDYYELTDDNLDGRRIVDAFERFDDPFTTDLDLSSTDGVDRLRSVMVLAQPSDQFRDDPDYTFNADDVLVFVGSSLEPVDTTVRQVSIGAALAGPLFVLLVGALTWFLTGRSLKPVEAVRREVETISSSGLHRRVPEPETDDEIARLANTMNTMLTRLEASQRSQQRFVSDASHELRSPLASMAALLDVAERHGTSQDWPETAAGLQRETYRMRALVDDLLLLARADASEASPIGDDSEPRSLIDLDDIVLEVLEITQIPDSVTIDSSMVSAGLVSGHGERLRRVVINLLDNAIRHATSTIRLQISENESHVVLAVEDDGSGIAPEHRDEVFSRFVRLDDARTRDAGGSGLGLAICAEIVSSHGGSISIDDSELGGARFVLELPRP